MLTKTDETVAVEREPLDTRVEPHVRIINGSLDEDPNSPNSVVLTGRLDANTLRFLNVDKDYQRPLGERRDIYQALHDGTVVPNIEIGVRGQDFACEGDNYIIRSPAYIIDGWQRVGTARIILDNSPNHPIRMFATVHFGTDALWERHRFTDLNKNVKKVSPNLHLRNMRDSNQAILTLYGLCHNVKEFPLYKRVCWGQNMARGELLTAIVLAKVARRLHAHHVSLSGVSGEAVAQHLVIVAQKVSLQSLRQNVDIFFRLVEECWGIRQIEYRRSAPQLRDTFLNSLARLLSTHIDFWDATGGKTLFVNADHRRKLAKFPLHDPHVKGLCGIGGTAGNILYDLLLNHMNSGKRTGHLQSRYARAA